MVKVFYSQEQFNFGQLGKLLRARYDRNAYKAGCKTLINFRPTIQGPAVKRKGTRYVAEVKTSSAFTRIIPFSFSETTNFTLELGNTYIRFFKDGAPVMSGMSPYEITSPYTTADLPNIKYAQIGDIMYLTAGGKLIKPQKLTRIADTNWTIADIDYQFGPVLDKNTSATTITLSGTLTKGGSSTWTASAATFQANHVGSVWGIAKSNDELIKGYAIMTGFTSSTIATFTNQNDLTPVTTTATANWYEAAWSKVKGFPYAICLHEQRLFFAGTDTAPLEVYGSVAGGSYENFDTGTAAADDGLRFELSGQINKIQWLESDGSFLVGGTLGGLAFISFEIGDTITPRARVGSAFGASSVQAQRIGDQIVYLHSNQRNLYQADYSDITLKYNSFDLTDYNPEILEGGATDMQGVEQPDLAALLVTSQGLRGISRDQSQEIVGWYKYDFDGEIESIAVSPSLGEDVIWLLIKRTINGNTKRYIEYIEYEDEEVYVDSAIIYDGAPTRTFTGLAHLEGKTVQVRGDDAFSGEYTVSSGQVVLPNSKTAVSKAIIGLPYNADLEIMPINIAIPETGGSSLAFRARVNKALMVVSDTIGIAVGMDFNSLSDVPIKKVGDNMDSPPVAYGANYPEEIEHFFDGSWSRHPTVCIRSNKPFGATIHALMVKLEVSID